MTPGEIAMAIAMGVLLIAGGYAIAYRAGRNREREREPSEAALFAGHADADAVDGERRMLAMLEEAVIVTDSSANVLVANEAAIERGLSVDGLIVDAGIRDLVQEAAQSDAAVERELELARDSQRLHVAVTAQCTADDRVTVVCADTGYRRSVDRVRRDFVTNVSHELKTPVGAMSRRNGSTASCADSSNSAACTAIGPRRDARWMRGNSYGRRSSTPRSPQGHAIPWCACAMTPARIIRCR